MAAARLVLGVMVVAAGIAAIATGMYKAGSGTEPLAIAAIPAGFTFVFGGALVLAPARWQALLGTLMITSLAIVFDWVAFGPGVRQFTSTIGAGGAQAGAQGGNYAARAFFGLFALLFDIAAIGLWIKVVRGRQRYTPH